MGQKLSSCCGPSSKEQDTAGAAKVLQPALPAAQPSTQQQQLHQQQHQLELLDQQHRGQQQPCTAAGGPIKGAPITSTISSNCSAVREPATQATTQQQLAHGDMGNLNQAEAPLSVSNAGSVAAAGSSCSSPPGTAGAAAGSAAKSGPVCSSSSSSNQPEALQSQQQQQQQQASDDDFWGLWKAAAGRAAAAEATYGPPAEPIGRAVEVGEAQNTFLSGAPLPPCEQERVAVMAQLCKLLYKIPRKELKNILQLVCDIFHVDMSAISVLEDATHFHEIDMTGEISLLEGNCAWRWSFCTWTLVTERSEVMVVNDTLQDPRFVDNMYVKEAGVRFYAGCPLVGSSGHRLGTLCFADTIPRVFDSSSLQVLINLSELVTRELERSVAVLQQLSELQQPLQLQAAQPLEHAASAAPLPAAAAEGADSSAAAVAERERQQQLMTSQPYKVLLRSMECVASAVLLIDTAAPSWTVLHASSGWEQLEQQLLQANAQPAPLQQQQQQPQWQHADTSVLLLTSGSSRSLGASMWSLLDEGSLTGRGGGYGLTAKEQMLKQVSESQSFNVSGARLSQVLGGVTVRLVFRCAGFSTVQGSVSVCLPASAPDQRELPAAAAALTASNPTRGHIPPSTTSCHALYFVTVHLQQQQQQQRGGSSGSNAAAWMPPTRANSSRSTGWLGASQPAVTSSSSSGSSSLSVMMAARTAATAATAAAGSSGPDRLSTAGPGQETAPTAATAAAAGGGDVQPAVVDVCGYPQCSASTWVVTERGLEEETTLADVLLAEKGGSPNQHSDTTTTSQIAPSAAAAAAAAGGSTDRETSTDLPAAAAVEHSGSYQSAATATTTAAGGHLSSGGGWVADVGAVVTPLSAAATGYGPWHGAVVDSSGSNSISSSSSGAFSSGSLIRSGPNSMGGARSSLLAGLVCERIAGLTLGGQVASGSFGRVYRGTYFGSKVAVKVLDGADVLRRDAATGVSLEALLSSELRHPSLVATHAWAVVGGKGQLPARVQVWGQTLDPGKPSIQQNRIAAMGARSGTNDSSPDTPTTTAAAQAAAAAATGGSSQLGSSLTSGGGSAAAASDGHSDDFDGAASASVLSGQTWLVMEYCDSGCLQDAVDRGWLRQDRSFNKGPMSLAAVLATAAEIASAMAFLHQHGVIHGDLSPYNVLLSSADAGASLGDRGFVAKVADFGLARTVRTGASRVVTKTYGTLTCMPPEVLEHGVISKAADVYSFGVLLWQMVSGSRAWAGLSHAAVVDAVCVKKLRLAFPQNTPEALEALGTACMEADPDARPSFDDILEVLEPCQALLGEAR